MGFYSVLAAEKTKICLKRVADKLINKIHSLSDGDKWETERAFLLRDRSVGETDTTAAEMILVHIKQPRSLHASLATSDCQTL